MKWSLFLLLGGLAACAKVEDERGPLISSEDRTTALDVPAFASNEFTVSGLAPKIFGAVTLSIGPGEIEQVFFTGHSSDLRYSITADLDAKKMSPTFRDIGKSDVEVSYKASSGAGWLFTRPGSVFLGDATSGVVEEAFVHDVVVRVDRTGVLVLEATVVPMSKVNHADGTWASGEERKVKATGRLQHSCRAYGSGYAVLMVPNDDTPRCAEVFPK